MLRELLEVLEETQKRAAWALVNALELVYAGELGDRRTDEHFATVMEVLGVVRVEDYEDGCRQYEVLLREGGESA